MACDVPQTPRPAVKKYTHIANSSRPGTFKRPGAGVAIRAPDTQTLPPVAGEGKLPTAIPIFQPWSRCHRDCAGWLMTSVEAKRKHWQGSWSKRSKQRLAISPGVRGLKKAAGPDFCADLEKASTQSGGASCSRDKVAAGFDQCLAARLQH